MSTKKNKPEKDKLRPLEADGIQEFDNELPRWWVGLFYITVIVGVIYGINLHFFGGKTLIDTYTDAQQSVESSSETNATSEAGVTEETVDLAEAVKLEENIALGKEVFDVNCVPCHLKDGGGSIGPNLTDNYWIHGGSAEAIHTVIANGVPEKGMPPWKPILGEKKVIAATAYLLTLKGTTPETPKAPQGDPE